MNIVALAVCVAFALIAVEALFFIYCFRWLASGKRQREKDFARLDDERSELISLQSSLVRDMSQAKSMSEDTLRRLQLLGAEAHAEWSDAASKMDALLSDLDVRTQHLLDEKITQLHKQRMSIEKTSQNAHDIHVHLDESVLQARKILRFFDKNISSDQIMKDLAQEKYSDARRMLNDGHEPSLVAKKLGLSQGEMGLLSHMR